MEQDAEERIVGRGERRKRKKIERIGGRRCRGEDSRKRRTKREREDKEEKEEGERNRKRGRGQRFPLKRSVMSEIFIIS